MTMKNSPEFVTMLADNLKPMGDVRKRAMFGGHGLFLEGLMFALIAEDVLYFKVDDHNRAAYEAAGLPPFTYTSSRGTSVMSYYRPPEECLEDPELLNQWARPAMEAARRAAAKKSGKGKNK